MMQSRGLIFDIKRFATHDGQGIRTTVFFKGCPLRCKWCQNPEGLMLNKQVLYMESKCMHCLSCVRACKNSGITFDQEVICVHRDIKEDWQEVCDVCPTLALCMDSKEYDVSSCMNELLKDKMFFDRCGGVTFSGGEPFLQYDFLIEILKECKKREIHTAIETSLYTDLINIKNAIPYLDQIYCDCKVYDSKLHQALTGVDNKRILENIQYLLKSNKKDCVIVRTPLIPSMTATKENIALISKFLSSIYKDVHYELLNYNPLAQSKYSYLGMEYCFDDNPKLYTQEEMNDFYRIARENGIENLIIE